MTSNKMAVSVKIEDFSSVAQNLDLIYKLRDLTLFPGSGLNYELDCLLNTLTRRTVNCKIVMAYFHNEMVGWALMSKEPSRFYFHSGRHFDPSMGILFEIFVAPQYRRQGIGSAILDAAHREANGEELVVCPWDYASHNFYDNSGHQNQWKL